VNGSITRMAIIAMITGLDIGITELSEPFGIRWSGLSPDLQQVGTMARH